MKTLFGAVGGALALVVALVAYDLGERQAFSRDAGAMTVGFQQPGQPYLVQAGQPGYGSPYATAAYGPCAGLYSTQYPYAPATMPGYAAPQYVSDRMLTPQPVVRRASTQRTYVSERSQPQRSWQKSAMLIGGSAAGGAGVGALIGGKKGAGIGALIGGGAATLYDQAKRH
jgi:hypothetical protein